MIPTQYAFQPLSASLPPPCLGSSVLASGVTTSLEFLAALLSSEGVEESFLFSSVRSAIVSCQRPGRNE